jgi:hypothetical protein
MQTNQTSLKKEIIKLNKSININSTHIFHFNFGNKFWFCIASVFLLSYMGHSQKMFRFHSSHSWKWRETLRHILNFNWNFDISRTLNYKLTLTRTRTLKKKIMNIHLLPARVLGVTNWKNLAIFKWVY